MTKVSDSELNQAFPREYPKDLGYVCATKEVSKYDLDRRLVVEKFEGKHWESIQADVLRECFDVSSDLNPRAFHYFFPAFIKQSQADPEKTILLVGSLVHMLADAEIHWPESLKDAESRLLRDYSDIAEAIASIDGKELSNWRQERWKLFTEQQWSIVQKWLRWIDQEQRLAVDRDVLREAMKNAAKWQVRRVGVTHER
mgnify:CR=1 FL=1